MELYSQALLIDVLSVICCAVVLFRFAGLRFSHPATPYLMFHLHTVTVRLWGLLNGAGTLYSESPADFEPVMADEIIRAAHYCDLALWGITLGCIMANALSRREEPEHASIMLEPRLLRPILGVAFLIGIVGLRVAAAVPGISAYELDPASAWTTSSYLIILPSWFGLAVLGYIYYYGFKPLAVVFLGLYLALMSVQGGMRFRVIIGVIMAVQIWVEQHGRRWPSKWMFLGLAGAALAFFPMKAIGYLVQHGASSSEMEEAFSDSVDEVTHGANGDQMFLDELGSALTLIDQRGEKYYGSIYLPLFTLPIPRALWPDKPGLSGFLNDISTSHRPMAACGMITTYIGEAYANFGLFGVFLVPPVLAILLSLFYRAAYRVPRASVLRFSYVLVSVNLIQVYRDGLLSVFVFTLVNMMPLSVIVLAHLAVEAVKKRRHLGLAGAGQVDPLSTWRELDEDGREPGLDR